MSELPGDLRYAIKSHEWVRELNSNRVCIGITDHAQSELGDVVYLQLPVDGRAVTAGEACAVIESVKVASDIFSPVSGTIVAVNTGLIQQPEHVNEAPYEAWIFEVELSNAAELADLLDAEGYRARVEAN